MSDLEYRIFRTKPDEDNDPIRLGDWAGTRSDHPTYFMIGWTPDAVIAQLDARHDGAEKELPAIIIPYPRGTAL